ncbi:rhodanese-related sulfurtransferase [Lysinibacillus composti]|uniref:Rhodanese-like domain-containing protein n=1 Tax=Lysinibacillus composti TaxID=720633 RepID=A0A3N9UI98_9BACI|nr:rhodanese-like domain-containing protein [Lysinibacillus composti]MBM7607786.1 rhodanese-related sulfurtransferase [Lysinibacillus composti]RQW75725.1 rhodanese-like domain-containing protein [Lysinibacillus composti]
MVGWLLILIVVIFFIWRMKPAKGTRTISTDTLKGILNDQDKVFIDVRTPREFKSQSIRQFKNIPLGSDFSKLPKDKEIIVICQSGMRSSQACKQLKKLGYANVTNVRGGMNAWRG